MTPIEPTTAAAREALEALVNRVGGIRSIVDGFPFVYDEEVDA